MKARLIEVTKDLIEFYARLMSVVILIALSSPILALIAYLLGLVVKMIVWAFKVAWL